MYCAFVLRFSAVERRVDTHTHTHICMCVCVYVYIYIYYSINFLYDCVDCIHCRRCVVFDKVRQILGLCMQRFLLQFLKFAFEKC